MKYIWHVGLGVGVGTRETRDHLSDAMLDICYAHLQRALKSPLGDTIPEHPLYRLSARIISGVSLCTVGHGSSKDSLCTFAVVTKSTQRAKAWIALHENYPHYAESRGDVPQAPYCAVRVEWGLANHLDAAEWLDAYQIAMAWAWIERKP